MGRHAFFSGMQVAEGDDRFKPIQEGVPETLWYKLLLELEERCDARGERLPNGHKLSFVVSASENNYRTYYPLHALRVSLITAYALEGGVPMHILSKCIAGHARLLMTIYYTKAGVTYVTELMNEAQVRMSEQAPARYLQWLMDLEKKDLKAYGVYPESSAVDAFIHARKNGTSLIETEKGWCTKGKVGCDTGGFEISHETGKVTYGSLRGHFVEPCPSCRWCFSGPAFLEGLRYYFNLVHTEVGDIGKEILKIQKQIDDLEDERYLCQKEDRPFLEIEKLNQLQSKFKNRMEAQNRRLA